MAARQVQLQMLLLQMHVYVTKKNNLSTHDFTMLLQIVKVFNYCNRVKDVMILHISS